MIKLLDAIDKFIILVGTAYILWALLLFKNIYTEVTTQHVNHQNKEKNDKKNIIIITLLFVFGGIVLIIVLVCISLKLPWSKYFNKQNITSIFSNLSISIFASYCFWLRSFKISYTKVIFSNKLAQPTNNKPDNRNQHGIRVRFANIKHRGLMEVSVYAKLTISDEDRNHIFFLDVSSPGKEGFVTYLSGFSIKAQKNGSFCRTMTLYPSESMQHELTKKKYPENLRKKAEKGSIQFNDIFYEYGENITIQVYIYGNDEIIGTRKMFISQNYTIHDIEKGDFLGLKKIELSILENAKAKQRKISQIEQKYTHT